MTEGNELLRVSNLKKYFQTPKGQLHAVDDISFSVRAGQTLGIVGESGCGKSTLGRTVLRILEPTEGSITFNGENILAKRGTEVKSLRRDMQMIFQDPYDSLDPRMNVEALISEPLRIHKLAQSQKERSEIARQLMEEVGIPLKNRTSYPHELDGGTRQRVGIARALSLRPKFIVCDEPVSALDVSIQAQILNLLQDLQEKENLTYMFITHNLSVVHHIAETIAVMYLGQIVELAPADELFDNTLHPYTQALLSAIPIPSTRHRRERILLKGEISSPIEPPKCCRFAKRCIHACERCRREEPKLRNVGNGHQVACFMAEEAAAGHNDTKNADLSV